MHDDTRDWDSMTPEQWEEIYPPWADDFTFNLEPGQRYRYVPDEQVKSESSSRAVTSHAYTPHTRARVPKNESNTAR